MELPRQPTPFVGRQQELDELAARLRDADCRLVSIVGPGGIGKTRLALEAASRGAAGFADGVCFISLQAVAASHPLAATLAEALQLSPAGQLSAAEQLLAYLQERELLLVLDNLEHLLVQVELLSELLRASAHLKVMTTSREVLGLEEEWVFRVGGLAVPDPDEPDNAATYDAVRFFIERARRVNPQIAWANEGPSIVRICHLVEGTPLALALAASWAGTLDCAAIAAEIEKNIGFLASRLRNVPNRHRSMRAVFDQTWHYLDAEEQAVFMQLAVFRGSFRREAAQVITTALLPTLSALVNKSLLQWDMRGRYHLHELLRQFAEEQLQASPEGAEVRERHCTYFADFLYDRIDDIHAGRQVDAMHAMAAELDNLRAAWHWAVTHLWVGALRRSTYALVWFWHYQSRYQEAADALQLAITALERGTPAGEQTVTLAEMLVESAWFCIRLGKVEDAAARLRRAQALYDELGVAPFSGGGSDPACGLAMVALLQGDIQGALRMLEMARTQQEARADQRNLATTYYVMTGAWLAQGDYAAAEVSARQAFHLANLLHDRWSLAYTLNDLGRVTALLGKGEEAKAHFRASFAIRHQFQDREGMAVALRHLGQLALQEQDLPEAARLFQESQNLYTNTGDLGGQAATWEGLGNVALAQGNHATAAAHFAQALQIVTRARLLPLAFSILAGSAATLIATGQHDQAVAALRFIQQQPVCPGDVRDRVRALLAQPELAEITPPDGAATPAAGQHDAHEAVAAEVLALLVTLREGHPPTSTGSYATSSVSATLPAQPLIEPLTPRELDVLRLMADGLSNQQIAEQLIIAVGTVKSYTSSIYGKLSVQNRVQAVARARDLELL